MTIKTVLVHLDGSEAGMARLETAIGVADAHGAHLTGLYVNDFIETAALYAMPGFPTDYLDQLDAQAREESVRLEKTFTDRLSAEGLPHEWRTANGDTATMVGLHARYADLAVVGQAAPDAPYLRREVPALIALDTGRPVLVVPYIGGPATLGQNILVGWDASREATRAVSDALPFLEKAKRVTVLSFNPEGGVEGHGDIPSADIAQWLARHDVKVEAAQAYGSDIDAGNALLSRAADLGADMLVMGAYAHSRLREIVIGGASREILREMTIPVLMSH